MPPQPSRRETEQRPRLPEGAAGGDVVLVVPAGEGLQWAPIVEPILAVLDDELAIVGEPGFPHDPMDARSVEPLFPDPAGSRSQNAAMGLLLLFCPADVRSSSLGRPQGNNFA